MNKKQLDETRDFWNAVAEDWRSQVGNDGDANRRLNSDPVLWKFAGDVRGLKVLDAGCGTGYLSRKLMERGARVTGIDVAERMIAIARAAEPAGDFRVDSCSGLSSIGDEEVDLVVANYVLMDTPDLEQAVSAFHRVLKPRGIAIVTFSHPCFPQGRATTSEDGEEVSYPWDFSYFDERQCMDPPWGHFTRDFIWFHRPLSVYWKAFTHGGFDVIEFEEPGITDDSTDLADDEEKARHWRMHPCSVAFKLGKTTRAD